MSEKENLSEMDFGSIAKTLKKYGGSTPVKNEPSKAPKRSSVHTDMAMTGHKEVINKDGSKTYKKVLPDHDTDHEEVKKAAEVKKDVAAQAGEAPVKRGRGRPAGSYGSYKPRSAETRAAAAAKSAASKAANRAAKAKLTKEDLDELIGEFNLNEMVDFLVSEEVANLSEADKKTLSKYIKSKTEATEDDENEGASKYRADNDEDEKERLKSESEEDNDENQGAEKYRKDNDDEEQERLKKTADAKKDAGLEPKNVNESVAMDIYVRTIGVAGRMFGKLAR